MDLTKTYPASVREEMHGIVQLKRTLDKGKAVAAGTAGEYHYNCPMDKHLFEFLGIDHEELLNKIKSGSDADVVEYTAPFVHKKSAAEIAAFNEGALTAGPAAGSESETYFKELLGQVAPDRTDVTSWADLLDLDEKRSVPQRVAA
jgi:hypothetical protein